MSVTPEERGGPGCGTTCALCGHDLVLWFRRVERDVYRCPSCGHIAVPAGVARLANGRTIYEDEGAVFTADGNAEYYLDETNAQAAAAKAAFVRRHCHGGTLIDVGASYGHFLAAIQSGRGAQVAGFEARGFELSEAAVMFSRNTFGVDNQPGSLYAWPAALAAPVDAITCWDVIEHVEDPLGAIEIMRSHLKPGGWLFLSTPDAGSIVARVLGARWHYMDPVQHIHLFSRRNLSGALRRLDFQVREERWFGRSYKISYVLNRLRSLHRTGMVASVAGALSTLTRPIHGVAVPIKLWDVTGIAAQRPPTSPSSPR